MSTVYYVFDAVDQSPLLRNFAANYIYTNPRHADFFPSSLLVVINTLLMVTFMFSCQLYYGQLSWWMVFLYYFAWVGIGGRTMGGAYALAHKEGHNYALYKGYIRKTVGNLFENVIGVFYGNLPFNFTTSHVFIHHKLDGGVGDTFYEWDLDRSSISDFMLYIWRTFKHMVGYSSYRFFVANNQLSKADLLRKGIVIYWAFAVAIFALTKSFFFTFFFYIEPLLCMAYFLALINFGFHGFLEFDENGKSIKCVDSTLIIEGIDDAFGEDDHMSHHYNSNVYYKDLPAHQATKVEEFKKYKVLNKIVFSSFFERLNIFFSKFNRRLCSVVCQLRSCPSLCFSALTIFSWSTMWTTPRA